MTDLSAESAELAGRRWVFGPAVLDERSLELYVGGEQVQVERKPLEVLLYLLHHAGEVVTKNDLAENLWPGRILTETVMARCISVLRQALQDDRRTLIRTVHSYGYRLVARVRVEASTAPQPPALDFKPGDSPPTRPQWRLEERLGTGGHGEAWLARHVKTGDARVFKFAVNVDALSSLKREITLYRLLHDSLGARAAIARILEWNLEEPPYFIEMEHIAGGNLQTWSETQGGLSGIPLSNRIELVAQVAEALAAAHSVGALHKDLKPGNVLIHMDNGRPVIRLCDFGCGTVLDPQRLETLGITRLGFTRTKAGDASGATPLYVAPEVIAGQPFTVQADIYSLGIMLYQIVAGDLRKALAPGWEADVQDELLREDIAAAAAGNPAKRLTDAAQLAERLRTLEQRRVARAVEAAAKLRAERARRIQEELRRMRAFVVLLCALAATAVTGGIVAYRARNEAVAATATAKAVSDFLMEDVLRIDPAIERPRDASYESLLNRAADRVESRFKGQDEAAASVHWLLGRRYHDVGLVESAAIQYEHAAKLYGEAYGRGTEQTLLVLDRLALIYADRGQISDALLLCDELRVRWTALYGPTDLSTLMLRARLARVLAIAGHLAKAEEEYRSILREISFADPPTSRNSQLFREWFGIGPPSDALIPTALTAYVNGVFGTNVLAEYGDQYAEAETRVRQALATARSVSGEDSELTWFSKVGLSFVAALLGKYEEAEDLIAQASDVADRLLPTRHYFRTVPRIALARLRLEQQRSAEAVAVARGALDLCQGCTPRVRAEILWDLGRALEQSGRLSEAIATLGTALSIYEKDRGPRHIGSLRMRVDLAEALRRARRMDEANATLKAISARDIEAIPRHPVAANFRRVQGLLQLEEGNRERALAALAESSRILEGLLGPKHWRTRRAYKELALARLREPQVSQEERGH